MRVLVADDSLSRTGARGRNRVAVAQEKDHREDD